MDLVGLPEAATVTGSIQLAVYLDPEDGETKWSYGSDGLSTAQCIGYLTVLVDRLRDDERVTWDTPPGNAGSWDDNESEDS